MAKRLLAVIVVILMCIGGAKALTPEELHQQIQYALEGVRQAELKLKQKAPRLADIWIKEKTNEEGHKAEVTLRQLYPKEYMEYLIARSNLDDLLYTQFLMFANGTPK